MSNQVTPVTSESTLSTLKSTRSPGSNLMPDTSFQQLLQSEIGTKSAFPPERPANASKTSAPQPAVKNEAKPLNQRQPAASGNNQVTSSSNQTSHTATAPENTSGTTEKVQTDENNSAEEADQSNTDTSNAAQILAMSGLILAPTVPPPQVAEPAQADTSNVPGLSTDNPSRPIIALDGSTDLHETGNLAASQNKDANLDDHTATSPLGAPANAESITATVMEATIAEAPVSKSFAQELQDSLSEKTTDTDLPKTEATPAPNKSLSEKKLSDAPINNSDTDNNPDLDKELSQTRLTAAQSEPRDNVQSVKPDQASAKHELKAEVKSQDETIRSVTPNPATITATATASNTLSAAKPASFAGDSIAAKVGTTAWDRALGQKVVWMVGSAIQSAELTLNPPDLGPLQVVLNVSNDQASASFSSAQPEVREALESAMPRLRQMLSDAGVQLSGFSVGAENQQRQQQQPAPSGRSVSNFALNNDTETSAITSAAPAQRQENLGLVDTFV